MKRYMAIVWTMWTLIGKSSKRLPQWQYLVGYIEVELEKHVVF